MQSPQQCEAPKKSSQAKTAVQMAALPEQESPSKAHF